MPNNETTTKKNNKNKCKQKEPTRITHTILRGHLHFLWACNGTSWFQTNHHLIMKGELFNPESSHSRDGRGGVQCCNLKKHECTPQPTRSSIYIVLFCWGHLPLLLFFLCKKTMLLFFTFSPLLPFPLFSPYLLYQIDVIIFFYFVDVHAVERTEEMRRKKKIIFRQIFFFFF